MTKPARCICLLILAFLVLSNGAAQEVRRETAEYDSVIDWKTGIITTVARVDIDGMNAPLPTIRQKASVRAESGLSSHLVTAIGDIPVSSAARIGDLISRDPRLLSAIVAFGNQFSITRSYVSEDFKTLTVEYRHLIYPHLASIFITHARASEWEPFLGFSPSTTFSGLVIYAKGALPVHGENGTNAIVVPALRPRIYDESMRLLFDTGMTHPGIAETIGSVGYETGIRLHEYSARIGDVPLVTIARGIFGQNRTDLIIPSVVADRIRAIPENLEILKQARIIVICELAD